jgi:iron uptake system EfeUOB component EfeO/EfeM
MLGINRSKREVRGEIVESQEEMEDKVLTEINVEGRNVTVTVRSRVDGNVLFKAEYTTNEKQQAAHFTAEQLIDSYTKANGYFIYTKLTNVDLPIVRTLNHKRTR